MVQMNSFPNKTIITDIESNLMVAKGESEEV